MTDAFCVRHCFAQKDEHMENEVTVYDYASPVHRVLMEPNVIMGIGIVPVVAIMMLTIIMMTTLSVWTGVIGLALYLVAKRLCKKDSFALEILFARIVVPDILEAS